MIGIYCITNKINGKKYIGQSTDILKRWKWHLDSKTMTNINLYNDIKKYGITNFSFEILELCNDSIELNKREYYWIKYCDSFINGYNMTAGGAGSVKYVDYNKNRKFENIKELLKKSELSYPQIAEKCGCSCSTVSDINRGQIARDLNIRYPIRNNQDAKRIGIKTNSRKINQYDLHGNLLRTFSSISDAYRFLNKKYNGAISDCCNTKSYQAYGYVWKYVEKE